MTCGACTGAVERAAGQVAGVVGAAASLETRAVRIEIGAAGDRDTIARAVVAAVEKAGYAAEIPDPDGDEATRIRARDLAEAKEASALFQRSLGAIGVGVVLMLLAPLSMDRGHVMHADAMHRAIANLFTAVAPFVYRAPPEAYLAASWTLALGTLALVGRAPLVRAFKAARGGHGTMDPLVVLSALASLSLSAATLAAPMPESYLDGAVMVFAFTGLGRALEARAKRATGSALVPLAALTVDDVTVVDDSGVAKTLPRALLRKGDCLRILPGARVAADALVTSGTSRIDEASLTGEPLPRTVTVGDKLVQGTLNSDSPLDATVIAAGRDGTLGRLLTALEHASTEKASGFGWVDAIAARFVPALLAVATVAALGWWIFGAGGARPFADASKFAGSGVATDGGPISTGAYAARIFASVVAVACPCALGLAIPIAASAATTRAAKAGLYVRGARAFAKIGDVRHLVCDKTGTLTVGAPTVASCTWFPAADEPPHTRKAVYEAVKALEGKSEHVLAKALVAWAEASGKVRVRPVRDVVVTPGRGLAGTIDGIRWAIGDATFLPPEMQQSAGAASVFVLGDGAPVEVGPPSPASPLPAKSLVDADGRAPIAALTLTDELRPEAEDLVRAAHAEGWKVHLFSGDRSPAVAEIGQALGIDDVRGGMLPADKAAAIRALRVGDGAIAMIGDGLNDAPALAEADLSLAPGSAVAASLAVADVVFLRGDLRAFPELLALGHAFRRTVHRGLFWAFAYNIVAIPVAAGLFERRFGIALTPATAGLSMAASSLLVVLGSIRLAR
jgi:heavy metal translocating P-type ATPase